MCYNYITFEQVVAENVREFSIVLDILIKQLHS